MTIAYPGLCCGEWACPSHLLWGMWTQKQDCVRHTLGFWFSTNRPLGFSTNCQKLTFSLCVWDCCSQGDVALFENQSLWIAHSNLPETPFWAICMEGEKMLLLISSLLSSSIKPPGRKPNSQKSRVKFYQEWYQQWTLGEWFCRKPGAVGC